MWRSTKTQVPDTCGLTNDDDFWWKYSMKNAADIVVGVIGAGAAGVACLCRLASKGISIKNIHVFEAQERIGGRIHTKRDSANGTLVELGAQWIHGQEGNVIYNLASKNDQVVFDHALQSSGAGEDVEIIDEDGNVIEDKYWIKVFAVVEAIEKESYEELKDHEGNLQDYFVKKFNEAIDKGLLNDVPRDICDKLLDWHHRFENCIDASDDWSETGGWGHTEYWLCPGDPLVVWKDGYETLFSLLMQEIPAEVRPPSLASLNTVNLNQPVRNIQYNGKSEKPVTLTLDDGSSRELDCVVFTGSLGVLKATSKRMFTPSLPMTKESAIAHLELGTVDKIFVEFEEPWWPEKVGGFGFLRSDNERFSHEKHAKEWVRDLLGFYTVRNNPNFLVGWIFGAAARVMERLPEDQILDDCHRVLKKYAGNRYSVTRPKRVIRSTWHSNPFTRGSYSYRSVNSDLNKVWARDLAEPICDENGFPVVMFAGEATHDHYYSTVHGAVESGWREADRLVSALRSAKL